MKENRDSIFDENYFDNDLRQGSHVSDRPSALMGSRTSMHTIRYSEIEKAAPKEMAKFNSKEDLLRFAEMKTGKRELTSFLIPDIGEVLHNLK